MSVLQTIQQLEHEQVTICHDPFYKLTAIIAIHNTQLGPSLGGTRLWNYGSLDEAMTDALRLSRGMTYKAAISGLHLGGGKAVIIADPSMKNEGFWRRYGKFVHSLGGKYYTAEDVNTSTADMEHIALETPYVTGKPEFMGGSGDPSPFTAYGVFVGIKACAKKIFGSENLEGKKILVQGIGHVGSYLVEHLSKAGAVVLVSDINKESVARICTEFGATAVDNDKIFDTEMDIYAPCALGATLNTESIAKLKCKIVAGAANNQLLDDVLHGKELSDRNILYAPDFLINAGGLMNVAAELGTYNKDKVFQNVETIYNRLIQVFDYGTKNNLMPQQAAMFLATERLNSIGHLKTRM
jgi:leucine dehydrogenase